ncbi:OLC1v1012152C1 [Oldenlandia corymbosa var. corymbosa]|uniref:OLC1v1012152C1 n=1 Tax=Oldenlandia corymbosa var. corymbosa TaxID=529605 RepID=A0AAV1DVV8_OLDCO|nr:OLC1v1012152C1 [Oldenlandia corymbosa var. corymbosa]
MVPPYLPRIDWNRVYILLPPFLRKGDSFPCIYSAPVIEKGLTVPPAEMQSLKDIPKSERKEYRMKSLSEVMQRHIDGFINKVVDDQEEEINLLKNSTGEAKAAVELWKNKAVTYQAEIKEVTIAAHKPCYCPTERRNH